MVRSYGETTETGHQWLGRVPVHWRVSPLSVHFDERSEFVSDEEFAPLSVTKDGVVPQMANVAKTDNGGSRKLVRAGDFAINSRSDRKGAAGLSTLEGSTSVVYTVLVPRPSIDGRFVHHLLRSRAFQEEFYRWGNGIVADLWSTRFSSMKRIPLAVPPLEEQRAIADYLDRETARIDTLIEEQQRLIQMLRERRRDVVSHAVLDATPNRVQLRRLVDVIDCAHVTAEFVEDDRRFPVASIQECQGATVDLSGCKYTTAEFFDHLRAGGRGPRPGDLLFVRNVSVGLVSVVTADLPEFAMGQETVLLRRKSDVHPDFLRYALSGAEAQHAIEGAMIGSTFRRINVSAIRSLPVAVPSASEQRRIAAYLDELTAKIDQLVSETERFIELSRERRSALITAAVTGQIDVREVA